MPSDLDQSINDAVRAMRASRHIVALVGAGISAESGVPTFRGPEGLWTKHGEPDLRDYERFAEDPKGWWEKRISSAGQVPRSSRSALNSAVPNDGHFALKEMEDRRLLKHTITQNIDNLHQVAGSVEITEIHGNRTKLRCILCGALAAGRVPDRRAAAALPGACGGIVKGDTVMFGEPIPRDALDECVDQTWQCDCMLLDRNERRRLPGGGLPRRRQEERRAS